MARSTSSETKSAGGVEAPVLREFVTMERQFTREFHIDETHRFIDEENFAIRKTSAGRGWRLTFMSVQEEGPYERSFPAGRNVLICVVNYGYMRGTLIAGGQKYILDGGPGTVIIIPDGV